MKFANSKSLAYLFAVFNAMIIGFSYSLTKIAVGKAGPIDTLAYRFTLAFVFFAVYLAVRRIRLNINRRFFLQLLPLAMFYPIGFFTFQSFGLMYAGSAEAGIITAMAPIITIVIAAVFIRERTNGRQIGAVLLSVAGVFFIAMHKSGGAESNNFEPGHLLGLFLVLLSCMASAAYTVTNRVMVRSFSAAEISFVLMLVGAVVFLPTALIRHGLHGDVSTFFVLLTQPGFLLPVCYLALFASLITSLLASLILRHITSSQQSVFLNLSTIISIFVGWFFLAESIYLYHIIGTIMILLGVLGGNLFANHKAAPSR